MKKYVLLAFLCGVTLSYAQTTEYTGIQNQSTASFGDIEEDEPLSNSEIKSDFDWKLYPNPTTTSSFSLDWLDPSPVQLPTLRVYNTTGQVVYQETFQVFPTGNFFDLGDLPTGLYIIELEMADLIKTKKLQVL